MSTISMLIRSCSGIVLTKPPFKNNPYEGRRFLNNNSIRLVPHRGYRARVRDSASRFTLLVGRSNHQLTFNDDSTNEPFWLTPIKEALWYLKWLGTFLVEQPSQLKYIEWPSFQNTLKTAALTLVLMALLIVALSSVDAALSFVLAILLRKPM